MRSEANVRPAAPNSRPNNDRATCISPADDQRHASSRRSPMARSHEMRSGIPRRRARDTYVLAHRKKKNFQALPFMRETDSILFWPLSWSCLIQSALDGATCIALLEDLPRRRRSAGSLRGGQWRGPIGKRATAHYFSRPGGIRPASCVCPASGVGKKLASGLHSESVLVL